MKKKKKNANCTYNFFEYIPSLKRIAMFGKSRQSDPLAVGMCAIRVSTNGAMSLQT